ncbi:MAG: DeoR/GlpR transcriptional regulator, partial [Anaerolineaceae bacterium]|nr:DeoR/GlpR transcriptional regulator [Anaerolineaceae bacterium]
MYNKERIEQIMEILKEKGSISVNELAEIFQVSGATIRSDLTKMDAAGLVTRTHGGAMMGPSILREPAIVERVHDDKKQLIAEKALEFVHERDIILIDTGTTMLAFAQALARSDINELTVFSNDLDVIRTLEEKEHFSLSLFGGKVRNGFHYCYGNEIENELSNYHFSSLFLASSAVHSVYG